MGYTEGPWRAENDEILGDDGDTFIATVPLHGGMNPTEWQANLRLIAAAPDLLAALKAMRDGAYGNPSMPAENDAIDQMAETAIAKAEGR